MEIKGSLENALGEIDALRSKVSELSKRKDVHQIELDLLLQKLRELYDFLRSIQPVKENPVITKPIAGNNGKTVRRNDKFKPADEIKDNFEVVDDPSGNSTITANHIETPVHSEQEKSKNIHSEKKTEVKPEILDEKSADQRKSVHELHSESAQKRQSQIGTVLHSKPILNIEDAIGVNDKFLFIRELFNSNASRYKETIDALNNASDFNSAYSYIEKNFDWDFENEAAQKLLELVRRRHISHKNG